MSVEEEFETVTMQELVRRFGVDANLLSLELDRAIVKFEKKDAISCRTCTEAHCCLQTVLLTIPDGFLIASELKATSRDTPELRKKLRALGEDMASTDRSVWFERRVPCVFLDEKKRCSVYSVRPMVCRSIYVVSPVENCAPPGNKVTRQLDLTAVDIEWIRGSFRFAIACGKPLEPRLAVLPLMVLWCLEALDRDDEALDSIFGRTFLDAEELQVRVVGHGRTD